jgi:drug/metabolite transporter (DMT)-like permease
MQTDSPFKAHAALLLVSCIYGFFYIALKLLLVELSPMLILWLRLALSACLVLPIELLIVKTRFSKSDLIKCILIGLIGVYCVHFSLVQGAGKTSSFFAALIMASVPLITLLLTLLSKMERPHWQRIVGISVGFLGVVSVLIQQSLHLTSTLPLQSMTEGNLWVLGAAICFALFLLLSQSLLKRYRAFSLMAYSYIFSALALTITFVINPSLIPTQDFQKLQHASSHLWLLIGFIVFCASILTYSLNNYALKRTSPNIVAMYMFLAPIQAAVWGYFVLQEPFSPWMGVSALLTFSGILLANQAPASEPLVKEVYSEVLYNPEPEKTESATNP